MFNNITEQIGLHKVPTWKKLDNRSLHLAMYLSTKSGISFQTARAFAIILTASLLATYLDVESDCEQQSKTELKTIYLSFVWWSLLDPHSSKAVKETSKNAKVTKSYSPGAIFVCLVISNMRLNCIRKVENYGSAWLVCKSSHNCEPCDRDTPLGRGYVYVFAYMYTHAC